MAKRRPVKKNSTRRPGGGQQPAVDAPMRIIGGRMKNKKLEYSGDARTRPMKERVREAVFNLIGPSIKEKFAVDLFAGTGALGLEAISRGATSAVLIERHVPTTKIIRQNAEELEVVDLVTIAAFNSFIWCKHHLADLPRHPWVVFFAPPYDLFVSQWENLEEQFNRVLAVAPAGSILIVEFDEQFDPKQLPRADEWDIRVYWPAHVGILRIPSEDDDFDAEDEASDDS